MDPPVSCGQCKFRDARNLCRRHPPRATIVPSSLIGSATTMWPYVDPKHDGCWEGEAAEDNGRGQWS